MNKKLIVIACSTGGPKVLQDIIPKLPGNLKVPVIIVQHMQEGFTLSLANRLDLLSEISVTEACDNELILPGRVYVAKAGKHIKVRSSLTGDYILFSDEEARRGVKPCADYLFESLIDTNFNNIVCIVLTGMGNDGTEGILKLSLHKNTTVIVEDETSSVVYGMPASLIKNIPECKVCNPDEIVSEIIRLSEV